MSLLCSFSFLIIELVASYYIDTASIHDIIDVP